MKRKPAKHSRLTLARKIKIAKLLDDQRQLAFYGRILSPAQREAELHFRFASELPKTKAKATADYFAQCLKRSGETLSKRMLEAVEHRDAETLRAIANHLETLPAVPVPESRWRWMCLGIKDVLTAPGGRQKIKMTQLAKDVGWPAGQSTLPLRRIAKEVGIPLDLAK